MIKTSPVLFRIQFFDKLASTNSYLKKAAECGDAQEGDVVVTAEQSAGRGRLGRTWESPRGMGLLFSFLTYPSIAVGRLPLFGLLTAIAVIDGIKQFLEGDDISLIRTPGGLPLINETGHRFRLKWPNDILYDGRKLAGILCETGLDKVGRRFVVAGVGVNVQQRETDFGAGLRTRPTSLYIITGRDYEPRSLLNAILDQIQIALNNLRLNGAEWIVPEWKSRSGVVGQEVTVDYGNKRLSGIVVEIEPDGSLTLKLKDGTQHNVSSGDIV